MAENYLSSQQKNAIIKRTSELVAIETVDGLKRMTNIKKLNNRLRQLGKIIEKQATIYYTNEKHAVDALRLRYTVENNKQNDRERVFHFSNKRTAMKENKKQLNAALGEAYVLIMLLRQSLLDEKIDYHIYIGSNFGDAQVVTFNDFELLNLMNFAESDTKIKIGRKNIEEIKKDLLSKGEILEQLLEDMEKRTNAYQDFFSKIIEDFEVVINAGQTLYKINRSIIDDDKSISDNIKLNLFKKGTKDIYDHAKRQRAAFNRGHLTEAFDIAYDEIITVGKQLYNYDSLRYPPFYKNLYYDNIKATRGGDNAVILEQQFSVKAFSANLYNVSTLYGDLIELTDMIDLVLSGKDESELVKAKEHLYNMFFSSEKYQDALVKQSDKTLEKVFDEAFGRLIRSK